MPSLQTSEPTGGDSSKGRNSKAKEDHKRKEEQDFELVATTNEETDKAPKRNNWNGKPRKLPRTYEEIMSGPCLYHSFGIHKA